MEQLGKEVDNSRRINYLIVFSFAYLLLPFLIFCLAYLRSYIGLPIVAAIGWIAYKIFRSKISSSVGSIIRKSDLIIGLIILSIWVLFSGVGGYAFQNSDFYIRNAIFKDLINYQWPVYYSSSSLSTVNPTFALTYYFGFWLPAALIGKLLGLQIANLFLFIWTLSGVFLTAALLKERIKSSLVGSSLLLIFFSGMDILGTLLTQFALHKSYPTIWPPITHLEWWVSPLQFTSLTAQLFWVVNQALPAWICIALILNGADRRNVFFIWALCFFLAPYPALGLLPFILLKVPRKSFHAEDLSLRKKGRSFKLFLKDCLSDIIDTMSLENLLGGGLIAFISYLFYSANPYSSSVGVLSLNILTILIIIVFLGLEGILLLLLFFTEQKKNLWWYVTGVMLLITPVIVTDKVSFIFGMRASIPALFFLMVFAGEALFRKPKVKYHTILILFLVLGAFSPIYELNRSIYRTVKFYSVVRSPNETNEISRELKPFPPIPEQDHPLTLTADIYTTLNNLDFESLPYFSKVDNSFFFKYLAKPPSQ